MCKDTTSARRRNQGNRVGHAPGSRRRPLDFIQLDEQPGLFRTYGEFLRFLLKAMSITTLALSALVAFVLSCINQPPEATLAGVGMMIFATVFHRLGRDEEAGWQVIGWMLAGGLAAMAFKAWGVLG